MAGAEGRFLNYNVYHATGTNLMKKLMEKLKPTSLVNVLEAHEDMVYTADVAEFYKNVKVEIDQLTMMSTVAGKKICVSPAVLSKIYGLTNEGKDVATLGRPKEEEFWLLAAKEGEKLIGSIKKTQLRDEYQRLADIIVNILECSTSALDGLPKWRFYTMVCLYYGLKVNWVVHMFMTLATKKSGHVILISHLMMALGCTHGAGKVVHKLKEFKVYESMKSEAKTAEMPEKKQNNL